MTVQRCPFCGALLDVEWSKAHAPHCPNRRQTKPVPDELADIVADWLRRLDDLEQLLVPDPPDYRIPQDEDATP